MTPEIIKSLSNLGMHFSQEDIWEAELKASGWKPTAAHKNSQTWVSPDGVLTPGPGFAWQVMKGLIKV